MLREECNEVRAWVRGWVGEGASPFLTPQHLGKDLLHFVEFLDVELVDLVELRLLRKSRCDRSPTVEF